MVGKQGKPSKPRGGAVWLVVHFIGGMVNQC
jgi:hypothetical protein